MSIRNAMYRMVVILIILPFLLFSLLVIYIYTKKTENLIAESLQAVANAQITEMKDFCLNQKDILTMIGTTDITREAMRGNLDNNKIQYLKNTLDAQVQILRHVESFTIIDKNYRVLSCNVEHEEFADIRIKPLIAQMGDKSFYITNILNIDSNDKTILAISCIKEDGEILGYILVQINPDFYENIRSQTRLWNNSTFYLLDGNNSIISAGNHEVNRGSFISTAKEREDFQRQYNAIDFASNPSGRIRYKFGGRDYITYYSDVEYTDWRVMLTADMSNYKTDQKIYHLLILFIITLCGVCAIWIGSFTSQRIIRPIARISGALADIQHKQDYSLRIAADRRDELGTLTVEINQLLDFVETEDLYKTQQQRILQQKADQDALTKVLNKERIVHYLQDAVNRHRDTGTSMAVLFVDVDNFKSFNTSYGHSVGDQVLLFLVSLLSRETKGTVGRMGGDEFLVIVEDAESISDLDKCLKQVRNTSRRQFRVRGSGGRLPVTCCIGVVRVNFSLPETGKVNAEELIDLADAVMYMVKSNGKHGYMIIDYNEKERYSYTTRQSFNNMEK